MRLALIPARGGSKRIPRKNIRDFCGRPMLAWPVAAALESGCFDRVVVSTDDEDIAQAAREAGAEVPFMRPATLADDQAGTIAVIRHAIGELLPEAGHDDLVCLLYATAPFVQPADLTDSLAKLRARPEADFALSVCAFPAPIQRALRLDAQGRVSMFDPAQYSRRSQDLEPAFHDAGQFCWGRADAWMTVTNVFTPACLAFPLPPHRVQDIDTPDDWQRAEWMFRAQGLAGGPRHEA
ncbi:pseudaminic acid cytidylyltransferase [Aquincola tertiaricarbonis]|uniref:Pseudaminic acid cytidylyltransferase n=1 Tax=Aquincola tertiaricarbonis TaxID=391953 RepID=A0ABY4S5D1_AQUTE|nr:pseudaminic acid cytidylyltransferase [Aquincola tertiaricarbonis]URI06321.1 pseudaminic acid cytidylyltransferase [Aquincola tertiaricarbonis]